MKRAVLVTYSGTNPSAAAMVIKKAGTNTTDAVGTGEQLVFVNFEIVAETGGQVLVSGGTGCQVVAGKLPVTGGGISQSICERRCRVSTAPTITGAAGSQVDFTGEAFISSTPQTA